MGRVITLFNMETKKLSVSEIPGSCQVINVEFPDYPNKAWVEQLPSGGVFNLADLQQYLSSKKSCHQQGKITSTKKKSVEVVSQAIQYFIKGSKSTAVLNGRFQPHSIISTDTYNEVFCSIV